MADNKVNSGLLEFSEDQKVFVALDAETSEVKKAVTIDGDGVETDIQGVQPTGKKEITSTAEVNVASYATAQVVDEDLVASNIKKDVDILGVVGSYEGGGDVTVEALSVTENGTYSEEGKAYSPVTVNVASLIPLKTVTVTAHYDETGATPTNITGAQIPLYIDDKNIAQLNYEDSTGLPVSMLGNINSIKIPVYNDPDGKSIADLYFGDNDNTYSVAEFTINSGDASNDNGALVIAGDCDVTFKLESLV